jgi:membrane-associated phospholipid phosphatase
MTVRHTVFVFALAALLVRDAGADSFEFGKTAAVINGAAIGISAFDQKIWTPGPCRWCKTNSFDDWFIGGDTRPRKNARRVSDILLLGSLTSSLVASGAFDANRSGGEIGVWVTTMGASVFTLQLSKQLIRRQRPYARSHPDNDPDDNKSFFSGHTALSVAGAVAARRMRSISGREGGGTMADIALVSAGVTGALRVAARKHYVTDVAVGAVVGVAAGILVPKMMWHKTPQDQVVNYRAATAFTAAPLAQFGSDRQAWSVGIGGSPQATGVSFGMSWR